MQIALSNRHLALKLTYALFCTASIVKLQLANIVFNGDLHESDFGEVFKNISYRLVDYISYRLVSTM